MNHYLDIDPLRANIRACRSYTRHYAKSFYFSSHVLPRAKRDAAYAVYAFCRYADNVVDATDASAWSGSGLGDLDLLRAQLEHVYNRDYRMDPRLLALRHTVETYGIPKRYFLDLLEGVEMDRTRNRFENFEELDVYCYRVASVVGLIMTHIFGVTGQEAYVHAAELGTAMQLTNILRDVAEDLRLDRVYLPQDELRAHGLCESDLRDGIVDDRMRAFLGAQIARARRYYASAELGLPMITNDGSRFCVRLMLDTYSGILTDIERHEFDVFTRRAHVPLRRKLAIALRAALQPSKTGNAVPAAVVLMPSEDVPKSTVVLHSQHPGAQQGAVPSPQASAPSPMRPASALLLSPVLQSSMAQEQL